MLLCGAKIGPKLGLNDVSALRLFFENNRALRGRLAH